MPTGIELSAGVVTGTSKPLDAKYGPYATTAAALADVPVALRYQGLTIGVTMADGVVEYWFRTGVADADFVEKKVSLPEMVVDKTYGELNWMRSNSQLVPGQHYKITDFRLQWWDYTVNNPQPITSAVNEPLIVMAITTNAFGTVAYSTLYPADIIYYEFSGRGWNRPGSGFDNLPNPNGWITRRIGMQYVGQYGEYHYGIVDTNYDWRNVTWSCRRCDLSGFTAWSPSGTYSLGQVVKHYDKLFISLRDSNAGRISSNGFMVDNPPDFSRAVFSANSTYQIGDEVAYTAVPGSDPNAATLGGALKHYRKTNNGAVGTLPTNTATWTEASLLPDFDYSTRYCGFNVYNSKSDGYFANPFYWGAVSSFTEGKTYFPTDEQHQFQFFSKAQIDTRLPNDETPWSLWGSGNGSGTPKYSQFYGLPRLGWNINIYSAYGLHYVPWDLSTKAQKPTFAIEPHTTNSTFLGLSAKIKIAGFGNVFYDGQVEHVELGEGSNFNIFRGGGSGSQPYGFFARQDFSYNRIGQGVVNNVFGISCRYNSLGSGSHGNVFGNSCSVNTLSLECKNNTFGQGCFNNMLGATFQNNNVASQFLSNLCVGWFLGNTIGDVVAGNVFGFYTASNVFQGSMFNNSVTVGVSVLGKEFNNNTGYIQAATIYGANYSNFGDFQVNEAKSMHCCNFQGQVTGCKLVGVGYIEAGNAFNFNTAANLSIFTVGPNFIFNTIEPFTVFGVDLTAATKVYGYYDKRIFKVQGSNYYTPILKLGYVDANGVYKAEDIYT